MTKVLLITNKADVTTDFIVKELKEQGISFYRFNTEDLCESVHVFINVTSDESKIFDSNVNQEFNLNEFTSVYYRRPELPNLVNNNLSEDEILFLKNEILFTLEGIYKLVHKAYWISPIYAIREAENKIYQLVTAKNLGFSIPNTLVTNQVDSLKSFYQSNKEHSIIKPIKSGQVGIGKDSKVIFTNKLDSFPSDRSEIEDCPIFIQNQIEKQADVRVTVVGEKVFAVLIHSQDIKEGEVDWRRSRTVLKHTKIKLEKNLEQLCVSLVKTLRLRFGAIDLVLDREGKYTFLEINPNGQWAWIEKQSGYPISKEIVNLLTDASV
jgi:glutathione synthase/RimK-type ligase-like ATP-grasp enzyme